MTPSTHFFAHIRFFSYYDLQLLLEGFLATFVLALIGCVAGFVFGFLAAILRLTRSRALAPVRAALAAYCLLFRRVPFLVTLMLVFFASQSLNAHLSTFSVASISVCLIAAAYLCEIARGGLQSVHVNQSQAARALNFSHWQTLRLVVVPQAWRVILPPTFGFFVMFIKDTALASQVGVMELTSAGKVLGNKGVSAALVYGTILMLYFLMSYPLSRVGKWLERRLAAARNH
jgi:polar amino acid transport system permease protein